MSTFMILKKVHPFFVYLLAHMAMEVPYISSYGKDYLGMMRSLAKDTSPPVNEKLYILLAYVIFAVATYVIVFREILTSNKSVKECIILALLYGGSVYGVFNLTNMVAFKGYRSDFAIRDMAYGTLSTVVLAMLACAMRPAAITVPVMVL